MTLLYNFGLTAGSLMAYLLESMLNPVEQHPCLNDLPQSRVTQKVVENITLSTTLLSTATTTVLTTIIPTIPTTTYMSNVAVANNTLDSNR